MKTFQLILAFCTTLLVSSCLIGDSQQPVVHYDSTLIELLCQNPELSIFCKLANRTTPVQTGESAGLVPEVAWVLQFSGRQGINPDNPGIACPENVETVFAPSDSAFQVFIDQYPHWRSIYDIPLDTVALILKHHIYIGNKLTRPGDPQDCATRPILLGSAGMPMWYGRWTFVRNPQGDVRAFSNQSMRFLNQNIVTPDLSSTDGSVFIINQVLGPF